jgi:hypothetical protein
MLAIVKGRLNISPTLWVERLARAELYLNVMYHEISMSISFLFLKTSYSSMVVIYGFFRLPDVQFGRGSVREQLSHMQLGSISQPTAKPLCSRKLNLSFKLSFV